MEFFFNENSKSKQRLGDYIREGIKVVFKVHHVEWVYECDHINRFNFTHISQDAMRPLEEVKNS